MTPQLIDTRLLARAHRDEVPVRRTGRVVAARTACVRLMGALLMGLVCTVTDSQAQRQPANGAPTIIRISAEQVATSPEVRQLVEDIRRQADAFIFLSGGASRMSEESSRKLLDLFAALSTLSDRGLRIAVGDGGTKAGIMEAAGVSRRVSGHAFALIGVSPAPEVLPLGAPERTPVDPNHTHIVAVDNPGWVDRKRKDGWTPDQGYWGSETETMYALFARMAEGKTCRRRAGVEPAPRATDRR